ncbi:MAG: galactokinase family protein [Eubacteriales bacterium]|nr:galactokinase family protein [Eubacteriales bacterium]
MRLREQIEAIQNGLYDSSFGHLYGEAHVLENRRRYLAALENYQHYFQDDEEIRLFSSPGRAEISGNHTDHQHGRVICASVDMDIVSIVRKNPDYCIHLKSEAYDKLDRIDLHSLELQKGEREHSAALLRGVAAGFAQRNYKIGGYDSYTISNVPSGSGISSSAAFELLNIAVLDSLYNEATMPAIERAKIGQFAENEYFGKPSGLLDQCGSAIGRIFSLDFKDFSDPKPDVLDLNFEDFGHALVLTKTNSSHADLTDEYAAVPREMREVANYFGKSVLRDVDEEEFYSHLAALEQKVSDRAILRAMHFFTENQRVQEQIEALKRGDFATFLAGVRASGLSSWTLLQNIYVSSRPHEQTLALALAYAAKLLGKSGACRVHGGGFSGTILSFVPLDKVTQYIEAMDAYIGHGSSSVIRIRPCGACEVLPNRA